MQMINELGEPVYLGPTMEFEGSVYEWMDFEWELWIESQSPISNRTWMSVIFLRLVIFTIFQVLY